MFKFWEGVVSGYTRVSFKVVINMIFIASNIVFSYYKDRWCGVFIATQKLIYPLKNHLPKFSNFRKTTTIVVFHSKLKNMSTEEKHFPSAPLPTV